MTFDAQTTLNAVVSHATKNAGRFGFHVEQILTKASTPAHGTNILPGALLSEPHERLRLVRLYCENQGDKFRPLSQEILAIIGAA